MNDEKDIICKTNINPNNNNIINNINNNKITLTEENSTLKENEIIELTGQILYRRIFGKKLCILSITNNSMEKITECVTHDNTIIKQLKIGDLINIKGKVEYYLNNPKIEIIELKIIKKNTELNDMNFKRKIYMQKRKNINKITSLCFFIKRGLKCEKKNCDFRHEFLNEEEKNKILNFIKRKENMYKKAHEGDFLSKELKLNKKQRNSEFADFIVKTFDIEKLKKGLIIDIAGGKGITTFYLKVKYNLNSLIIDPRGTFLPKKYQKELNNLNIKLDEKREFFNKNNCEKFLENCVLIIGMHPDEATGDIVEVALKYNINFAVVPCCVFPNKFPERKLKNGNDVVDYVDIVNWILEKDDKIQVDYLNIEGRNKILYKIN